MGAASQIAAEQSDGPGTFRIRMFDVMYQITQNPDAFSFPQWELMEV